jgi:hypothetical protein
VLLTSVALTSGPGRLQPEGGGRHDGHSLPLSVLSRTIGPIQIAPCFDTIRCNYATQTSRGGFIRGMRTRTETRHRTQTEIDRQVRLRERNKLVASAMMIAYFGWVVMIVGLLLTMLSADDLTVAGAVASIGFCVMLWIGPILIWPEYFAR